MNIEFLLSANQFAEQIEDIQLLSSIELYENEYFMGAGDHVTFVYGNIVS